MKKTATRIGVLGLLAAVIVFVGSGAAVLGQQRPADRKAPALETAENAQQSDGPVYLYFADPKTGYLAGEARRIRRAGDPTAFCRKIIEALIDGPKNGLMRTLPGQTALRALYITDDGIAYADFNGDVSEYHPRGVRSELLSVYSIVNTLILNTDGIRAVKILVNGKQADTLAGHVDIRLPLKAQMLLVR